MTDFLIQDNLNPIHIKLALPRASFHSNEIYFYAHEELTTWINHSKQSHFIWLNGLEWKSCLHSMSGHNLSLAEGLLMLMLLYLSIVHFELSTLEGSLKIKRLNRWVPQWGLKGRIVHYSNRPSRHLQLISLTLIHRRLGVSMESRLSKHATKSC